MYIYISLTVFFSSKSCSDDSWFFNYNVLDQHWTVWTTLYYKITRIYIFKGRFSDICTQRRSYKKPTKSTPNKSQEKITPRLVVSSIVSIGYIRVVMLLINHRQTVGFLWYINKTDRQGIAGINFLNSTHHSWTFMYSFNFHPFGQIQGYVLLCSMVWGKCWFFGLLVYGKLLAMTV